MGFLSVGFLVGEVERGLLVTGVFLTVRDDERCLLLFSCLAEQELNFWKKCVDGVDDIEDGEKRDVSSYGGHGIPHFQYG